MWIGYKQGVFFREGTLLPCPGTSGGHCHLCFELWAGSALHMHTVSGCSIEVTPDVRITCTSCGGAVRASEKEVCCFSKVEGPLS